MGKELDYNDREEELDSENYSSKAGDAVSQGMYNLENISNQITPPQYKKRRKSAYSDIPTTQLIEMIAESKAAAEEEKSNTTSPALVGAGLGLLAFLVIPVSLFAGVIVFALPAAYFISKAAGAYDRAGKHAEYANQLERELNSRGEEEIEEVITRPERPNIPVLPPYKQSAKNYLADKTPLENQTQLEEKNTSNLALSTHSTQTHSLAAQEEQKSSPILASGTITQTYPKTLDNQVRSNNTTTNSRVEIVNEKEKYNTVDIPSVSKEIKQDLSQLVTISKGDHSPQEIENIIKKVNDNVEKILKILEEINNKLSKENISSANSNTIAEISNNIASIGQDLAKQFHEKVKPAELSATNHNEELGRAGRLFSSLEQTSSQIISKTNSLEESSINNPLYETISAFDKRAEETQTRESSKVDNGYMTIAPAGNERKQDSGNYLEIDAKDTDYLEVNEDKSNQYIKQGTDIVENNKGITSVGNPLYSYILASNKKSDEAQTREPQEVDNSYMTIASAVSDRKQDNGDYLEIAAKDADYFEVNGYKPQPLEAQDYMEIAQESRNLPKDFGYAEVKGDESNKDIKQRADGAEKNEGIDSASNHLYSSILASNKKPDEAQTREPRSEDTQVYLEIESLENLASVSEIIPEQLIKYNINILRNLNNKIKELSNIEDDSRFNDEKSKLRVQIDKIKELVNSERQLLENNNFSKIERSLKEIEVRIVNIDNYIFNSQDEYETQTRESKEHIAKENTGDMTITPAVSDLKQDNGDYLEIATKDAGYVEVNGSKPQPLEAQVYIQIAQESRNLPKDSAYMELAENQANREQGTYIELQEESSETIYQQPRSSQGGIYEELPVSRVTEPEHIYGKLIENEVIYDDIPEQYKQNLTDKSLKDQGYMTIVASNAIARDSGYVELAENQVNREQGTYIELQEESSETIYQQPRSSQGGIYEELPVSRVTEPEHIYGKLIENEVIYDDIPEQYKQNLTDKSLKDQGYMTIVASNAIARDSGYVELAENQVNREQGTYIELQEESSETIYQQPRSSQGGIYEELPVSRVTEPEHIYEEIADHEYETISEQPQRQEMVKKGKVLDKSDEENSIYISQVDLDRASQESYKEVMQDNFRIPNLIYEPSRGNSELPKYEEISSRDSFISKQITGHKPSTYMTSVRVYGLDINSHTIC